MNVAVIGAGSWGTALAQVAAANGHDVRLWARRSEVAEAVNSAHRNPDYLKDADLSPRIWATPSVEEALAGADAVISVTPSKYVRATAEQLAPVAPASMPIVVCSKGVEVGTGLVPTQVFEELLGNPQRIAALSGPNHAEEIVHGVAAGTVVASESAETAEFFQKL